MSKRHLVHLACDLCGRNGAKTWGIHAPDGEKARVDLCPKCDDPARKMFVAGRRSATGPQGSEAMEDWVVGDYRPNDAEVKPPAIPWTAAKEKRG